MRSRSFVAAGVIAWVTVASPVLGQPGTAPASPAPQPSPSAPAASAVAATSPAAAEEPRQSLGTAIEVEPGATCLSADMLVRRVERWLDNSRVDARIRVYVKGDPSAADRVDFIIDRGEGQRAERHIDDAPADCDQLHSALALSIALAIDASVLGGGPPPQLPSDDEVVEPKPTAPQGPPYFRAALAVQGQASSGVLTDVGLGAGARVELGFAPWLDLRVGGLFGGVSEQRVGDVPGTFDAQVLAGRADACGVAHIAAPLRLLACGAFLGGAFRTQGDFTSSQAQGEPWFAAGAGLEVQVQLVGPLWLGASVDLVVPLMQRRIVVLDISGQPAAERDLTSAGVLVGAGPIFRFF